MKAEMKGHEKSPEDGRKMCGTWTKLGVFGMIFLRRLSANQSSLFKPIIVIYRFDGDANFLRKFGVIKLE